MNDEAYSIIQTTDGGYAIAGLSLSNNDDVTGNHGSFDYWVVKLSADPLAVSSLTVESNIKLYPNPVNDYLVVNYGLSNWNTPSGVNLEIVNELGQMVYEQELPQYSGFQKLDITKYAAGIYTAFIKRNEQVIAVQKFAKTAP